ncbi:MAG: acetate/propionate family kinase [Candidatus Melainabacteria bacterium]|nr:acetate/propionate family kinase [Candidatus Melainabacteria bacterium]
MNILVFNAGSSTLKASLFNDSLFLKQKEGASAPLLEANTKVQGGDRKAFKQAAEGVIEQVLKETDQDKKSISIVGHRVVHGGEKLRTTTVIDADVISQIEERFDLAPTHNPNALGCIDAAREFFEKNVKQIAVFDTAFHRTIPEIRSLYAVPREWVEKFEVRRYGFHGINHSYCARRTFQILPQSAERLIICHLGNGCSLSAVLHGVSVNTTMGFTPLEGLMMGTRSGTIDPGIVLHLLNNRSSHEKYTAEKLEQILNKESGILAISGSTSDMRELLEARKNLDERAVLAFDMFIDRLTHHIASFTASLSGIDALIFTGGIGEHSPEVRRAAVEGLGYLGLKLDAQANQSAVGDDTADAIISTKNSRVAVLKIRAQEDLEIARQCFEFASSSVFSSWP